MAGVANAFGPSRLDTDTAVSKARCVPPLAAARGVQSQKKRGEMIMARKDPTAVSPGCEIQFTATSHNYFVCEVRSLIITLWYEWFGSMVLAIFGLRMVFKLTGCCVSTGRKGHGSKAVMCRI